MQELVHSQTIEPSALTEVDQSVQDPLHQTQPRQSGNHCYEKTVDTSMGSKPPIPRECLVTTRALLHGHSVTLKGKVAKKMAHHESQQQTCSGVNGHCRSSLGGTLLGCRKSVKMATGSSDADVNQQDLIILLGLCSSAHLHFQGEPSNSMPAQ